MATRKINIGIALLVVLQLGQLGWLSALQYADWTSATSAVQLKDQILGFTGEFEALQNTQSELKQTLDTLEANAAQLEILEDRIGALEQLTRSLSTSQADTVELRVVLAAKMEELAEDFAALKKAAKPIPPPLPSTQQQRRAVPVPAARVAKRPATPKPAPTPSPPFVVLGIETRAGEPFASVARDGAARLDEVQLLRAGEAYNSWKLLRLEPENNAAVFLAGGQERVVSLR
ncbi:hypothetical protein [Pseudomonas lopnurensis]|uniref:hypothetical protein n=1 Tax=Pseudomonas lopnurensis TaxID=1477517 RepID=UPI0028ABF873|nr:hypothetical protein [Pseudomonas lopnurensis]